MAEQGTHEALVDRAGIYSELWSAQEMLFTEEEEEERAGKRREEEKRKSTTLR